MPIISEGIYWFTGTVIYTLGTVVFVGYLSLLIYVIKENASIYQKIFLFILLFLSCGFNEVLSLLVVFSLGAISYVFYKNALSQKRLIIAQFLISCLFAAGMIFSPGNAFREAVYSNAHNFSYSFIFSSMQIARFSFLWVFSIPLIAASIVYFQVNKNLRKENKLFKNSFYITRWFSLLLLFAIIFICVFPPYWATGILGQHRTLNVAYFFFIIMWFINLTVWYNYHQAKLQFSLSHKIQTILTVFLFIGLTTTGNGYNSFSDVFSGSAMSYDGQMKDRYEKLESINQSTEKEIIFSPISNPPKSLFVSDITDNEMDWTNQAYNLYFRLDSLEIVLK